MPSGISPNSSQKPKATTPAMAKLRKQAQQETAKKRKMNQILLGEIEYPTAPQQKPRLKRVIYSGGVSGRSTIHTPKNRTTYKAKPIQKNEPHRADLHPKRPCH